MRRWTDINGCLITAITDHLQLSLDSTEKEMLENALDLQDSEPVIKTEQCLMIVQHYRN